MSNKELHLTNYNLSIFSNIMMSLVILILTLMINTITIDYDVKIKMFGWLGYVVLLWGLIIFYRIKKTNINVYTFFFIMYMLFSYGQILLYALGIQHSRYDLVSSYSDIELLSYCSFFILSTIFFLSGAIIAIRKDLAMVKREYGVKKNSSQTNKLLDKSVKIVVWFLFFISSPIYMSNLLERITTSIQYGYGAIYVNSIGSSSVSNILSSIGDWFIPSILFMLVLYKKKNVIKHSITLLLITIIIGNFITGQRGGAMILVLSLIFLWDAEVKKFRKSQKLFLLIVLFLIVSSLSIIGMYRGLPSKTVSSFIEATVNNQSENLFVDVIAELGGSMDPWLRVNQLIPKHFNFRLGGSYVAAFLSVIPSILLGGYSFTEYAALGNWLMDTMDMSYGPGFSMHAESFYNFGWGGVPFMFLIGWFYYKLLSNNFVNGPMIKYKNVLSAIAFYLFAIKVRGSLHLTIRDEVYIILLPLLLIYLLYNTFKKRKGKENTRIQD